MAIPALSAFAQACAGTYDPAAVPTWQDALRVVHVYETMIEGVRCFTFEGTHDWQEWIVDFMALEVPSFEHVKFGPVHLGFYRDVVAIAPTIQGYLTALGWPPFYISGHSKGASEALLLHAEMKACGHSPLATRVFEPARPGGAGLREYLVGENIVWTETRNKHGTDIVTQVPFGPTWCQVTTGGLVLPVGDELSIPAKHEIAGVLAGLTALPAAPVHA